MEHLFLQMANSFNGELKEYAPYPKASQREAWEALDNETSSTLIKMGEAFLGYDFPQILATDFMAFKRTGNRTDYEDKLFAKRKALNALVLAECVEHKGRFLDDIINGIYAICLEPAWQLPPHNSYLRNKPQEILPDFTHPVIELFSCEASANMATVYYLLKDELDAVSPYICKLICNQVDERVITPYLNEHFWWMGNGDEPMCNWTVWCTQNTLLTAFLTPHSDEIRRTILKKASDSIDLFLKDYGVDGCCDEGAQYYRHAGLCLFMATDILCDVTDGFYNDLWKNEKIKNIAMYIANVHVDDKYFVNFADCSPVAGRSGVREYLFGKRIDSKELTLFAAKDYKASETQFQPDENNTFYRLQEIFERANILATDTDGPLPKKDIYYPSVGICILHDTSLTVGIKSGDNDDSHNHNDTGSITVFKNGLPLLIDIGVESYTAKTFSNNRYEIWTMQSDYHNLPTINGFMQHDGAEFAAKMIDCKIASIDGTKNSYFIQDIAGAYPKEAGIESYLRKVEFDNSTVTLTDSWSKGAQITQNFMTYEKPEVIRDSEGKPERIAIGQLGEIDLTGLCKGIISDILIEEHPITDKRLMTCWKHSIYRARIIYDTAVDTATVTIK